MAARCKAAVQRARTGVQRPRRVGRAGPEAGAPAHTFACTAISLSLGLCPRIDWGLTALYVALVLERAV